MKGAPIRTLQILDAARVRLFLFGLVLPITLAAAGFFIPGAAVPLFALGGLCAFFSGWALKFTLIARAAYNQGYAVERTAVHGAGVAEQPIRPGWSVA